MQALDITVTIMGGGGNRLGVVSHTYTVIEVHQAHTPGMWTFDESDTAYESFGDAVGAAVQFCIETVIDA